MILTSKNMELQQKEINAFIGKVVRKDLAFLVKGGLPVPTYVLEYLLGQYFASDDEEVINEGLEKIKMERPDLIKNVPKIPPKFSLAFFVVIVLVMTILVDCGVAYAIRNVDYYVLVMVLVIQSSNQGRIIEKVIRVKQLEQIYAYVVNA